VLVCLLLLACHRDLYTLVRLLRVAELFRLELLIQHLLLQILIQQVLLKQSLVKLHLLLLALKILTHYLIGRAVKPFHLPAIHPPHKLLRRLFLLQQLQTAICQLLRHRILQHHLILLHAEGVSRGRLYLQQLTLLLGQRRLLHVLLELLLLHQGCLLLLLLLLLFSGCHDRTLLLDLGRCLPLLLLLLALLFFRFRCLLPR